MRVFGDLLTRGYVVMRQIRRKRALVRFQVGIRRVEVVYFDRVAVWRILGFVILYYMYSLQRICVSHLFHSYFAKHCTFPCKRRREN